MVPYVSMVLMAYALLNAFALYPNAPVAYCACHINEVRQ